MTRAPVKKTIEVQEDTSLLLRWGKLATRIAAIGATVTGAFAAFFSTSSLTSGVTLTVAGASTLAAAEKLPDPRYVKTKHIPPHRKSSKSAKKFLAPDILPKPEKIILTHKTTPSAKSTSRAPSSIARTPPSYERNGS